MDVGTNFGGGYLDVDYKYSSKTTSREFSFSTHANASSAMDNQIRVGYRQRETVTSEEIYYRQSLAGNVRKISEAEETPEQMINLGIGFVFIDGVGRGMSASQIIDPDSEDTIVRVKISLGGSKTESYDVNVSQVDPTNASAIEMFAFCQYADHNGTGVENKWGSWHALKQFSRPFGEVIDYNSLEEAVNDKQDWAKAMSGQNYTLVNEKTGEVQSAADVFKMLVETIKEEHKLTSDNIKNDDDWRTMDDDKWEKLIEHIDKFLDDYKEQLEHLKEVRQEAAMKAAADAPADMKAIAAANAMTNAALSGLGGEAGSNDTSYLEKQSWTYMLDTDDQTVLAIAKMANEFAPEILSKSQELALMGDTTAGIVNTEHLKETATAEGEGKDKTWTITAFTDTGIVSNKCKNGQIISSWKIEYKNPDDSKRVNDFLGLFAKDDNMLFSGSKEFWEDFLAGKIDGKEFYEYYKTLDEGKVNLLKTDENGERYVDFEMMEHKYYSYVGVQQIPTFSYEELMKGLEESARIDKGYGNSQPINTDSYAALHIADAVSRGVNPLDELRKPPKAPYEHLATDGVINYKGATFILDTENNSINLGDVSIEAKKAGKVISVPLEGGGTFNFNVDNMDQLGRAIDMFSPEDINRIMRAIHQYKMAQSKQKELDDTKDGVMESIH